MYEAHEWTEDIPKFELSEKDRDMLKRIVASKEIAAAKGTEELYDHL